MATWSVAAAVGAAIAVLVLPGLPVVLGLRLRPLTAAAMLAPTSLLLIAVTAEAGSALGLPWSILPALVLGVAGGILLALLGRRARRRGVPQEDPAESPPRPGTGPRHRAETVPAPGPRLTAGAILGGLAVGAAVILAQSLSMMGSVDRVSQTYDNVFHLNAIRHILRLEDASAWVVGGMTALPGEAAYYPSLWHQSASLVTQLSGGDIVLASNVLMLLVGAVVWPLGVVALVRGATPAGPAGWFLAGALAGVTGLFPLSLMSWGIVLPYLLSIALLPLVVLVLVQLLRLGPEGAQALRGAQLAVLVPVTCLAVALAHPQGVFAAIALGVPLLLWSLVSRTADLLRRLPRAGRRLWPVALLNAAVLPAVVVLWQRARPPQSSAIWEPNASLREAIGQVGSLAPNDTPTQVPLGVVMALALVAVALMARSRWMLGPWLAAAALSVATRAVPTGDLRYLLTGNFYSDNYRVTAVLAVIAIPILAVGSEAVLSRVVEALPELRGAPTAVLTALLAAAVLVLGLTSPASQINRDHLVENWQEDDLLTDDERALLEQLPEVVPEGAVIATNAWNGSSLAYAISDREVLNTFMGFEAPPEVHLLNAELSRADEDPEVCDAVTELDVEYALDFGPDELLERSASYTGLNDISESGSAQEVLRVGDAVLLRMLPCRGSDGSMTG